MARLASEGAPAFAVCFTVGGALEGGATESVDLAGGGVRITTRASGVVVASGPEQTRLITRTGEVQVRHLLPAGVDLTPLLGYSVNLRVDHSHGRVTTVDARIWAEDGRLLLWARDGELPHRDTPLSLRLQTLHAGRHPSRLALASREGALAARPGEVRALWLGRASFGLRVIRAEVGEAAFLLLAT